MSRSRTLASVTLALLLGAAACTADDPEALPSRDLDSDDIILTAGLETVADCDALLARLVADGIERVGPYGFNQGGYWWGPEVMRAGGDDAMAEEAADGGGNRDFASTTTAPASDAPTGEGGDGVSGTNTQEVGVDEADIVKTDGNRMIVVANGRVQILDISEGTPVLKHSIQIDEYGGNGEIFLHGDQALLMSTAWNDEVFPVSSDLARTTRFAGSQITRITTIDLERGTTGLSIEFEGNYLSAREIDGTIRIVVRAGMGNFGWLYPSNPDTEDAATEANQNLLRKSTIGDWLPAYRVLDGDASIEDGLLFDCNRTHLPAEFSGFGSIGVLTVDSNNNFTLTDSLGVVTDGETVYASTDRLTVATARHPEWDPTTGEILEGEQLWTALHNFDITESTKASYVASGRVDGYLLNQYSLSEHNGYLRVATTRQVGKEWNDTASSIVVLGEAGQVLKETGRVDGLGKGEQIFAVRYQGDVAYVVTFRQTDPLYVIDLSDPNAPAARGELKIPGFSNYLHPLGDGLLMGIGQDATDEGRTTGAQVSLFDIADMDNPTRIDTLSLGGENSNSIVQWDARAFTYWAPTNTAIVPVESWNYSDNDNGNRAGAVLVEVADRKLLETGRVDHRPVKQCESYYEDDVFIEEGDVDGASSTSSDAVDAEAEFSEPRPAIPVAPPEEEYC
ncbi:MAG: beta-propeller domain-containing protein, partial [Acidimicrobiales bacterium]